jgi:thiol-disulfide isomerase/thioredoxin
MRSRLRNLKHFGLAVLFTGALLALAFTSFRPLFRLPAAEALESSKAPVWELKDPDGQRVKSSDFAGKVVILNFWATWCAPCKAEIPGFIELQKIYGERGLVVVGISIDEHGVAKVKQFTKELGVNYPIVLGNVMMIEDFGGEGIPTTFVIDRSGKIVAKHLGFTSKETLEREVLPLF